jgi:small neutral amino acid transporter SnatA (MarC family)
LKDAEKHVKTAFKILEFIIVSLIAFHMSASVYEIFFAFGFDAVTRLIGVVARWFTFFFCLYIYYRSIKKRLNIKLY